MTAFHGRFNQFHGLHLLQVLLPEEQGPRGSHLSVRAARRSQRCASPDAVALEVQEFGSAPFAIRSRRVDVGLAGVDLPLPK